VIQHQAPLVGCDVFCRVVDNFGDAAVAWRIARILANEHLFSVRLLIDRIEVLQPLLGLALVGGSEVDGVTVCSMDDAQASQASLLIETFGCGVPERMLQQRPADAPDFILINVEYLTAEAWIENAHRLSSPARQGMPERHFFFPGFTARTGGILRERHLERQRRLFGDPREQDQFLKSLQVEQRVLGAHRLSWFTYPSGWSDVLFEQLSRSDGPPLHVIVAEGVMREAVGKFCGSVNAFTNHLEGRLQVSVVPFLAQGDYDRLLLCCDLNLVRGEDSFVRAQLAGRPMLWDIYPQDQLAHEVKLDAFLERYCDQWDEADQHAQRKAAFSLIRRSDDFTLVLRSHLGRLEALNSYARQWVEHLEHVPELGAELAKFAQKLLKSRAF
jgi:uncharacterized repeat protein (TIGR03837 family)